MSRYPKIDTITVSVEKESTREGGGRRYIYDKKVKILHGPSPGVKCVAPLVDTCP